MYARRPLLPRMEYGQLFGNFWVKYEVRAMLLLTNDDGIHADGLRALEKAAHQWQSDVITVAPLEPHSGCGHRVTVDRPLVLQQVEENRYS